jgi:hypothetical protein
MSADHLVNVSHLRQALGITWHILRKYQRIGVISEASAYVSGRPHWRLSQVDEILQKINEHEMDVSAAIYNYK